MGRATKKLSAGNNFTNLEDAKILMGEERSHDSYGRLLAKVRRRHGPGAAKLFAAAAYDDPAGEVTGFRTDMLRALLPLLVR